MDDENRGGACPVGHAPFLLSLYDSREIKEQQGGKRFCQLLQNVWLTNFRTSGKAVRQ